MIYYFKAIKSLVDTKAKNSLTSYPASSISEATATRPRAALPFYAAQKGILILLTEVVEEIMEKIKTPIMIFFSFYPAKLCFSMTDCMINDTFGRQLLLKMWRFLERQIRKLDLFFFWEMQLFAPLMHWLFLMWGNDIEWWWKELHL